jgi:hypothetical protein
MTSSRLLTDSTEPRRRHRLGLIWAINLGILVLICGWILSDGRSQETIKAWPKNSFKVVGVLAIGLAYGSLLGIFLGLFSGPRRHRSLKAWLAFTALLSAWCALYVSWHSLYNFGQTVRVWWDVPAYEAVVTELREHWPGKDGESPTLGHFLAYPLENPRTLLLIGVAQVPGAAPITAIERSDKGALRFQLAGAETGVWLEWHPEDSEPETFVGGLENHNELVRQTRLRPHWYLVRYHGSVNPN